MGIIACIVADWGTTNFRAWALDSQGAVLERRNSPHGLLAIEGGRFGTALAELCGNWLTGSIPVLLSGMVGSKLGWKEAPYLPAPASLDDLARHLCAVDSTLPAAVRIVPGVKRDDEKQPDVMRGEETQILGALQMLGKDDAVFVLPGTHSKWAIVQGKQLVDFRTYMTGEVFGLLRTGGTLGQLIQGDSHDPAAFADGVLRGASADAGGLLHRLFSVRTLGLLGQMPRSGLASYLSGLLIGAEVRDGLAWLRNKDRAGITAAIGSPVIIESYREAVKTLSGAELAFLDSAEVVPSALFSIARASGLLVASAP